MNVRSYSPCLLESEHSVVLYAANHCHQRVEVSNRVIEGEWQRATGIKKNSGHLESIKYIKTKTKQKHE
jgi:hypothetical protein